MLQKICPFSNKHMWKPSSASAEEMWLYISFADLGDWIMFSQMQTS